MPEIVVERWTPVLELYNRRKPPANKPFAFDLLGEKALKGASLWPGRKHNVRVLELGNDAFFYQDALPGQKVFKPRGLILDSDIVFREAGASRWIIASTPEEIAARVEARQHYEDLLEDLEEIDPSGFNPEQLAEHNRKLGGVRERVEQMNLLNGDAQGFLNTFQNLYDSGAEGIVWDLSLPNVPVDLISKDNIGQDRAITLRVLRAAPDEEQAESHNLIFKFTDGRTQYALVFGRNNSVQWLHYRNPPGGQGASYWTTLEERLRVLEDDGRLTGEDNEQKRKWEEEIEDLKEAAKKDGRSASKMTTAEKAAIQALKDNIKALKASKTGLTAEAEKERAEIFKKLFYDRANVNLQEDTKSLYERIFDVTVRFLRKGQVQIQLDKQPAWTWTNGAIAKLRKYSQMLPEKSRVIIHSDGGAWGACIGRPRPKKTGDFWTAYFSPGYSLDADSIRWEFDADFVESTYDPEEGLFTGIGPFGQKVEASVFEVEPESTVGGVTKAAKYQVRVKLFADPLQVHSPEIHHIRFASLASGHEPLGAPVWRSLPSGDAKATQYVADLLSQDSEDKTPHYEAIIQDSYGRSLAPLDFLGREAVVRLIRVKDGVTFTMLGRGVCKRAEHKERRGMLLEALSNLFKIKPGSRSQLRLHFVGLEEYLNKDIKYPVNGNGKFPNDFIRELCQNAGLREEEFSLVPAGDIGITRLPSPAAGEEPDIKPEPQVRYWDYITEVVANHCRGWRFIVRSIPGGGASVALEPDFVRDRPDLDYRTTRPSWDLLHIRRGFEVYQDLSEYFTEAIFTGAVDPQTGKRWAASKSIIEATNPDFEGVSLFYVGSEIVYIAPVNDSLTSYEACVLAARAFMDKVGRPPFYITMTVPYNPGVRCSDLIRVDGIKVVVENIQRGSIKPAKGTAPNMTITGRFFEDLPLSIPEV